MATVRMSDLTRVTLARVWASATLFPSAVLGLALRASRKQAPSEVRDTFPMLAVPSRMARACLQVTLNPA